MKVNLKNERIKRKFFRRLKEADGLAEATIDNIEKAIQIYEDFTKSDDFVNLTTDDAVNFKKWLRKREYRDQPISLATYHCYLKNVIKFFAWLCGETGYKSKITPDKVAYFKLSRKDQRIATQRGPRNFPSFEYVCNLTDSIKIMSEVDLRDRALIAFTLLSGARDKALATLRLGCFDEDSLIIHQNPEVGVETKFTKLISTTLLRIDTKLLNYVLDWVKHLRSKGFGSRDPLFPCSKRSKGEDDLSFEPSQEVSATFWTTTERIRQIFKKRAEDAKLRYFPPHTFRHTAIYLALKHCKNGEQIKAISQNFGHENIGTTLKSYANLDLNTLNEIIGRIKFQGRK